MPAKYTRGYKYRLEGDHREVVSLDLLPKGVDEVITPYAELHRIHTICVLIVRDGYSWDGPSGPTWDRPSNMLPSLVHDALYQLIRRSSIPREKREVADDEFYRMCRERGMWKITANAYLWALKKFGASAAERPRTEYIMP